MNQRLNYIFCKYADGKKLYDFDRCYNHCNKTCPSVSNILHGKIFKIPVIKQIYNFCTDTYYNIQMKRYEKEYISEDETTSMKFVWGIKSYADLCSLDACLDTMNDIDLTYLKDENKYILSIETMLGFDDEEGKIEYTKWLLDKFTEWMKENDYDIDKKVSWYDLFNGISINKLFDTIEDSYAMFKLLVDGYCN